ncbi:glycosyl transferase family 17 [Candidatus Pelagibacter ubique]|nr:glycosyl transferase family 17 [Candidatus Pelagibacter ubique]
MDKSKIIDCITFFDNNFMFEIRYNILSEFVDYFVICESKFDHKGNSKKQNFEWKEYYDQNKIKYILIDRPFPKNTDRWQNQAIQREHLLEAVNFANSEDYIFFSDPDEIVRPELLENFELKKKYGIFMQDCFNYKFNLYNPHESPWEGTRVAKKKNIQSIDFLRQKVKSKNLKYSFFRFDKEKNIETFKKGGWHFNNILTAKEISLKLKTFAHIEFSKIEFYDEIIVQKKINNKIDLFNRGHHYEVVNFDYKFPKYLLNNRDKFKEYLIT